MLDDSTPEYSKCEFSIMYPVWKRNVVVERTVSQLRVKDKRLLFNLMRQPGVDENTFFPKYGITAGEFAVWHILADTARRAKREHERHRP